MDWILRLCGVLAGAYLLYIASQKLDSYAQASAGEPVMMTVTGEILPVKEAMKVNYLEAYNSRYPVFPAVLDNARWVNNLDNTNTCSMSPRKVWAFSDAANVGRMCKRIAANGEFKYECEEKGLLGGVKTNVYTVKFGDPILPDWALEKPHVTLIREGGMRKKTIGLQMCDS